MGATSIQWTDATWNPIRGCSRVSPGCDHCYAMGQAHRFSGAGKPFEGLTTIRKGKVDWTGLARFVPEMLAEPLRWKKPERIFVNSMSDLFHESLSKEEIGAVFGVMAACPQHTFQVLTKRAERMRDWFEDADATVCGALEYCGTWAGMKMRVPNPLAWFREHCGTAWPLPNVWLGVSCEDQQRADERIPHLRETPAAIRFVSAEPLLGPIDFNMVPTTKAPPRLSYHDGLRGLDWIICGGESGHHARECDIRWIESIVAQCKEANASVYVKQLGSVIRVPDDDQDEWPSQTRFCLSDDFLLKLPHSKGGEPSEWPERLRVRQFPEAR